MSDTKGRELNKGESEKLKKREKCFFWFAFLNLRENIEEEDESGKDKTNYFAFSWI